MKKIYQKAIILKKFCEDKLTSDLYLGILKSLSYEYYDAVMDVNRDNLEEILKYVYDNTRIHHVVYKNRKYYERTNQWSWIHENNQRDNDDPDVECDEYMDACTAHPSIFPGPLQIEYVIEKIGNDIDFIAEGYDDTDEKIRQFSMIANLPLKKVLIVSDYKKFRFINHCGINKDHRGSNHCKIDLPFEDRITIELPKTLYKFAQVCYRLKSHKFDHNYEMFIGLNSSVSGKHGLTVVTKFDHGS